MLDASGTTLREVTSFCRLCTAGCGVRLMIDEDDHIVTLRGDKAQPLTHGYACFKGLQAEDAHHGAARLLHPLKRMADGGFERIPLSQALDEIAERIGALVERDGPSTLGLFCGGGSVQAASASAMHGSFLRAIGSEQYFSVMTIDQSAKIVSFDRLGHWDAGLQDLDISDVVLLFGTNPLVSHATLGFLTSDPTRRIKKALADGVKLICIDPRRSETAHYAAVFLQPLPGHDAEIAAALIRIILAEGWEDAAFCARHVGAERLADLRAAVAPFTEELVAARAGLQMGELWEAAAVFARDHRRGAALAATGPSMAPFSNLMQHLVDCLNVVCGRFRQAGDTLPVSPLSPVQIARAEVVAPKRSWDAVPPSRIRGVGSLFGERLTATLADEILTPGEGQIRALIVDGANAANCIPDQRRTVQALRSLELLVVIDPYMTVTAQLADYILPPLMQYERPDLPTVIPGYPLYPENWAQYTPAILKPPAGSELIDDWRFFWEIAARLGLRIFYAGKVELDMVTAPATDDLLEIMAAGSAIDLAEIKAHPSGAIFDMPHGKVQAARSAAADLFDVMPDDVADECRALLAAESVELGGGQDGGFTHLLASRRLRHVFNSNGTKLPALLGRHPYNPAFLNPRDMMQFGLADGDVIEISSAHGTVQAVVQPDPDLRCQVVSLSHGWGGLPDTDDGPGSTVNLLTNCAARYEPINAMPVMSAIPVSIKRGAQRV